MMKRISVLLAEDHMVVLQGLRLLIEADGDIEVIGQARTGREAIQLTRDLHPEVIVMDIAMPLLNGLEATRQILKAFPQTKVLILSAHGDQEYVEQVMKSGALGYLVKQASAKIVTTAIRELHQTTAIRELHQGGSFFARSMAKRGKEEYKKSAAAVGWQKGGPTDLTSRESELLQLIAEGLVNKQIASELGISIKTVEKHRQHLMEKLNIHDIAGLTRFAIGASMVENGAPLPKLRVSPSP